MMNLITQTAVTFTILMLLIFVDPKLTFIVIVTFSIACMVLSISLIKI